MDTSNRSAPKSGYRHNSLTRTMRLFRKPLFTLSTPISHHPDEGFPPEPRRRVRNRHSSRELTEEPPVTSALRTMIYAYPTPEAATRRPPPRSDQPTKRRSGPSLRGRIRESRRLSPTSRYDRPVEITCAECGCRVAAGVRTVPCPYSLCCCTNLRVRPAPGEISRPFEESA